MLITALVLAFGALGLIGIYSNAALSELRMSKIALMGYQAQNLAETGLDRVVYAMKQSSSTRVYVTSETTTASVPYSAVKVNPWVSKDINNDGKVDAVLSDYSILTSAGDGVNSTVRMCVMDLVTDPNKQPKKVVVKATVQDGNGRSATKEIQAEIRTGSVWQYGMVGRDAVGLSGATIIDSYRSDVGVYNAATANYNGFVGTMATGDGKLDVLNAEIKGDIATGGGTVAYGGSAKLYPEAGTTLSGAQIDAAADKKFEMTLDPVTAPSSGLTHIAAISANTTLRPGNYTVPSISINNKTLTLSGSGKFVIVVTGNVDVGNGEIKLTGGGTAEIYVAGSVDVAGNGKINAGGRPQNFQLFGTGAASPMASYKLHGNTISCMAVYAPNASVSLRGTDGLCGAVVAGSIGTTGNYSFHYDETLANVGPTSGTVQISGYREYRPGDSGYVDL